MGKKGSPFVIVALAGAFALAACPADPVETSSPGTTMSRTINNGNYNLLSYSTSEIDAAAALDVYLEHASVGDCIVGTSYGTSGLALLKSADARYACGRTSFSKDQAVAMEDSDAAWFDANDGLGDNYRGNPAWNAKVSYFQESCVKVTSHVDVAMFKFCWIDPGASFDSVKSAMESLESTYPGVVFVWWTMPITTSGYGEDSSVKAQRQAYNTAVRSYCAANNKWLLDIADLECHDDSGNAYKDGSGNELLYDGYTTDGGHLETDSGKLKLAKAYWTLIVEIAKSRG